MPLCPSVLDHGSTTIHRRYADLLHPCGTRWNGVVVVPGQHVHLHRRSSHGRSRQRNAHIGRAVLLDAFLCITEDSQRPVVPRGI